MTQTTLVQQENPEWVLMAKALKGELTAQEQTEFSAWLQADEANALTWADASDAWEDAGVVQNQSFQPNVDLAWASLSATLGIKTGETEATPTAAPQEAAVIPLFQWNTVYKYAALFVLAAGLAWVGYLQFNSSPAWQQVATAAGERKMVYLPDGSQVTLNANSTLRYQTAFTGEQRRVELTGEAFFEVKRNPEKPFVIESGQAQTKVLGTSFNVRALPEEEKVAVAVVTGKVSLSHVTQGGEVLLTPGYTGTLLANGQLTKIPTETNAPAWRALSFQASTLENVARQLEEYFDVTIRVSEQSAKACTFTGSFAAPNLQEILRVLAASNDVKITKSATGEYTISGPGCQ